MKLGGTGGANTSTGLDFENKVDIKDAIINLEGYSVEEIEWSRTSTSKMYDVLFKNQKIGMIFKQSALYGFLKDRGIDYKERLAAKLLPDNVFYNFLNQTIYIIEVKNQNGGGSVDEKLQTSDFKKKQYIKLFNGLDVDVEYIYVLADYFNQPKFKDVFFHIRLEGCKYYFEKVPLNKLNLPTKELQIN